MERRGKSAVPLPGADGGMALFPQPQLLQGYANADLQKLNAARWICFNPRWPAAHGRSSPTTSSQASYRLRRLFMLCIKSHLALTPLLLRIKPTSLGFNLNYRTTTHLRLKKQKSLENPSLSGADISVRQNRVCPCQAMVENEDLSYEP